MDRQQAYIVAFAAFLLCGTARSQQGELDPTFPGNGRFTVSLPGAEYLSGVDLAVQPDGALLVAATAMVGGIDRFALLRFHADGTPDMDFGNNGVVLSDGGGLHEDAHGLALQPDGHIVVAGTRSTSPQGTGSIVLVRYDATGAPDPDFGNDGVVVTSLPTGWSAAANTLLLAPNGKLIVGGTAELTGGDTQALVARYQTSGELDGTFSGNGYAKFGLGFMGAGYFREQVQGIAVTEGGDIIAVGGCLIPNAPGASAFKMKVRSDGDLDGFGGSYFSWTDGPNWANNVVRTPDGDYMVVGRGTNDGPQMTYMHLQEDGDQQQSGALMMMDQGPHTSVGHDVAIDGDGRMYLSGTIDDGGGHHFGLVRMDAQCGVDPAFGTNGHLITPMGTDGLAEARAVAVQPDGRVVLIGFAVSDGRTELALARYLTESTTSVASVAPAPDLHVFPNPATDHLTVEYDLRGNGPLSLELVDAVGHVVDRPLSVVSRSAGPQRETFALPALATGTYLLRLTDGQGTRVTRVVVN
ncbi:MAG: T9SS type A sorting domain-containing protein [Bacteroidetes bacterium]|nr:T9SS type A sorting domain-containing protein [Bacteroidota bacterium]